MVVHYSGHGSQVPDLEGDEPDGLDETIVPHDSGRADPETGIGPANRDITDDEIYERLRKLSAKTDAITLIFDSCHSGTISRDPFGELTRYLEPDLRTDSGRPKPSVSPAAIAELKQAFQTPGSRDVGPTGFLAPGLQLRAHGRLRRQGAVVRVSGQDCRQRAPRRLDVLPAPGDRQRPAGGDLPRRIRTRRGPSHVDLLQSAPTARRRRRSRALRHPPVRADAARHGRPGSSQADQARRRGRARD